MTDSSPLGDRIADVVRAFPFDDFGMDDVSYALEADPEAQEWVPKLADAVLLVLPASADRAAVLREAADYAEATAEMLRAQYEFGRSTGALDVMTVLRRLADETPQPERDCPSCEAGLTHTDHCPTPETHNAGCGCPSDVAAAIASCPGYEIGPSPCRCPCYGCKHHCSAHDPAAVQQPKEA